MKEEIIERGFAIIERAKSMRRKMILSPIDANMIIKSQYQIINKLSK